jgi:hypothetical protein
MTVNPRRPAFRLPWTDDGAHEPAEGEAPATASGGADAAPPQTEPTEPTVARVKDAPVSDEFLQSLVSAMRTVAEESRDSALADLRKTVEARVEGLRAAAAERAEELRRGSEFDIVATGDWEKSEMERVKAEAERRVAAHRAELDRQLAEHRSASEREIEATRNRLADYERELSAFFTQLSEIHDPAEFVAAAKRMPRGPELPAATPAAPRPADGGAPTDGEAAGETAAVTPEAAAEAAQEAKAEEAPAADEAPASDAVPTNGAAEPAADQNGQTEVTSAEAPGAEAVPSAAPADQRLAKRLAELDRRLANGETEVPTDGESKDAPVAESASSEASGAAVAAPEATTATEAKAPAAEQASEESNGEVSTAIMVKGLGSFGAITSFKQALERADGIQGVTLSLGPGGEFVYRASHAAGFDLVGAIRAIEGQAVSIDEADGSLMVTIQRGR